MVLGKSTHKGESQEEIEASNMVKNKTFQNDHMLVEKKQNMLGARSGKQCHEPERYYPFLHNLLLCDNGKYHAKACNDE